MRFTLLTVLFLTLAGIGTKTAQADDWTKTDVALEASFGALLVADYFQTVRIIRDPVKPTHLESNPVMGEKGERIMPEIYFPLVALTHAGIAELLPSRYRKIWAGVGIAVQIKAVSTNWNAGYTFSF